MNKENWYLAGKIGNETLLGNDYLLEGSRLEGTVLGPFDKINIFVGANNSGKSRLMRRAMKWGRLIQIEKDGLISTDIVFEVQKLLSNLDFDETSIRFTLLLNPDFAEIRQAISLRDSLKDYLNVGETSVFIDFEILKSTLEVRIKSWLEDNSNSATIVGNNPMLNQNVTSFDYEILAIRMLMELRNPMLLERILRLPGTTTYFNVTGDQDIDNNDLESLVNSLNKLSIFELPQKFSDRIVYIPILRSTNRLWLTDKTSDKNPDPILFETTTRKNYEDELRLDLEVFTGQKLFYKIVAARNGRAPERKAFEEFETFLSNEFFSGKKIEIVAELGDLSEVGKVEKSVMQQSIQIHIEGDEDRKIHNLGDGIQALIMLTFPIFMAKDETHIFIEEPELNLHPGMQRIFLDVISKNKFIAEKKLKFFMTTHSNHFLDLTITENAPVSIFTLQRTEGDETDSKAKFRIKNVFAGKKELLTELGVQNSSVFIGNCSIWVEGVTDRKYIRRYLEAYSKAHKYKKAFREDLHFVFFEYAGSNLVHYSFEDIDTADIEKIKGMRLSNSILVIADKDDGKEAKHTFFSKLNGVNFQYRKLETALEIENLLTKEVVEKALPAVFPKLAEKAPEKIKAFSLGKIDERKFVEEYLFESIVKSFGKAGFTEVYPSVKVPKTLPSLAKSNLCEYVCTTNPITWEQMSDEAQELTIEIYEFISRNNPTL